MRSARSLPYQSSMSEPPPPGAEEEPLPPGAEEDQDELNLRLAKADAELNVIPASSTSEPGAAVDVTSEGAPAVSGVATSAGAAQGADPYAGYPGYDPNAAQYDYSAYWAQYGYSQAGYYPGALHLISDHSLDLPLLLSSLPCPAFTPRTYSKTAAMGKSYQDKVRL